MYAGLETTNATFVCNKVYLHVFCMFYLQIFPEIDVPIAVYICLDG